MTRCCVVRAHTASAAQSYKHILKYLAVRHFVASWKYRASFRRLHSALVKLVEVCSLWILAPLFHCCAFMQITLQLQQEAASSGGQRIQAQLEIDVSLLAQAVAPPAPCVLL